MPTKEMKVENIFIVDQNTGEEMELGDIATLTMTTDDTSQFEPIKPYYEAEEIAGTFEIKNMKAIRELLYKSFTVSGTIEEIVKEVFVNMPLGREVVDLEFRQNRVHKKKRINKKWAREYGYTCKVYYVEGDNLR